VLTSEPSISVAMITFNEEVNLPRTLSGLKWANEIIIVDSGSTDRTEDIALSHGARFYVHRDFRGHGEQKNIAIRQCTSEWILLLDADETVPEELASEIKATIAHSTHDAYWIPRRNLFLTRWMQHGGLYPDLKLRLFRSGTTVMEEGVGPHSTPRFSGRTTGRLKHFMMHFAYPSFDGYLEHMNRYSSEVASIRARDSSTATQVLLLRALLNPMADFITNYVFRFGFLDALEGLIFHFNHVFYVHWKYAKAWKARQTAALLGLEVETR